MKDVQFHHRNTSSWNFIDRYTVAVEMPSKNDILDVLTFGPKELNVDIGVSYVNPKDQYVKQIGRELSTSRLKPFKYIMKLVRFPTDDQLELYFYNEDQTSEVYELIFRVQHKSQRVHFICANLAPEPTSFTNY